MPWPCRVGHRPYLGAAWNSCGHKVHLPNLPRRSRLGDLGKTWVQPYAGHLLWLAWECVYRVLLLRGAATDKSPGYQPQARLGHLLAVELCCSLARMDPGMRRLQSAPGVGRVPYHRRRVCDPGCPADAGTVRKAALECAGTWPLRLGFLYHQRHSAVLPHLSKL